MTAACDYSLLAATTTLTQCGLGNVTGTLLTQAGAASGGMTVGTDPLASNAMNLVTATNTHTLTISPVLVQVTTGTPTLFLNTSATFSTGTIQRYGSIKAMRLP